MRARDKFVHRWKADRQVGHPVILAGPANLKNNILLWIFCQSTNIHCYRDVKSIPWNITKSVSRAGFSNLPTPPLSDQKPKIKSLNVGCYFKNLHELTSPGMEEICSSQRGEAKCSEAFAFVALQHALNSIMLRYALKGLEMSKGGRSSDFPVTGGAFT